MHKNIMIALFSFLSLLLYGQQRPTLDQFPLPPSLEASYVATPHFYERLTAFPDINSYYMYDFDDVKKRARSNTEYMVILGDHYRIGRGVLMSYKDAIKYYQRAGKRGEAMAWHRMAFMHAYGYGVPKDNKAVVEYLIKSADNGYVIAQYDISLAYLNGVFDVERDYSKAYQYLKPAAEQGHRNAMELLAMLAYHPKSVKENIPTGLKEARKWFDKAGDAGGNRVLLESINSFAKLRYFLNAIPGFIENVDTDLDPTDFNEGKRLLNQLKDKIDLLSDENFQRYHKEIVSNILHKNYFKAYGNRIAMLHFIINCEENKSWLGREQEKYLIAMARDYRLAVDYNSLETLTPWIKEIETYPSQFTPEQQKIIADYVYVALFYKAEGETIKAVADFFERNQWIISNLTQSNILHFETYHFNRMKKVPIIHLSLWQDYFHDLKERVAMYQPGQCQLFEQKLLPSVTQKALMPGTNMSLQLILNHLQTDKERTIAVKEVVDKARQMIADAPDDYFSTLINTPKEIYGNLNIEIPLLKNDARRLYTFLKKSGKESVLSTCEYYKNNQYFYQKVKELVDADDIALRLTDNQIIIQQLLKQAVEEQVVITPMLITNTMVKERCRIENFQIHLAANHCQTAALGSLTGFVTTGNTDSIKIGAKIVNNLPTAFSGEIILRFYKEIPTYSTDIEGFKDGDVVIAAVHIEAMSTKIYETDFLFISKPSVEKITYLIPLLISDNQHVVLPVQQNK
ncbi:MAG: tetratricopeptide repeat protein [Bacteroidales bacterium]|nr:tetratricopeptide repeat protein [Bacteroidales bacterium]